MLTTSATITAASKVFKVDTTAGPVALTLPNPAAGKVDFLIKKTAGANAITLRPATSETAIAEGVLLFQCKNAASTTGDYASIPAASVPDAGPWTIALSMTPTARFSAGGILVAKWNLTTAKSGFKLARFGDGLVAYFGNGTTNVETNFGYTLDTIFVAGVEREVAFAFNGAGATPADRLKISTRLAGGTWTSHTLTFGGTIPTAIAATGEPVTIARRIGELPASADFKLRDLRIFNAAIVPSGTSDVSGTLTARWRFRALSGMTTPDEVGVVPMTLTSTWGGLRRPARAVVGWQAGTSPDASPKILCIGDSKTAGGGSGPPRSAYRYEMANQLAARYGLRPDLVGPYTDAGGGVATEFAYNAQHSGVGGHLLGTEILARCTSSVATYTPDIVILEGGTNDVLGGANAPTTRDRMGACIDAILAASATAKVVVMSDPTISTATYPTEQATLVIFNGLLPALVASKGPRVSFIDVYALTCEDYLGDAAHMNEAGYARIAEALADAIMDLSRAKIETGAAGADFVLPGSNAAQGAWRIGSDGAQWWAL